MLLSMLHHIHSTIPPLEDHENEPIPDPDNFQPLRQHEKPRRDPRYDDDSHCVCSNIVLAPIERTDFDKEIQRVHSFRLLVLDTVR